MEFVVVCVVALVVSALTLFSGFGLGTLLMSAFALFFPVPVAVAATAVVHLANSLFKVALVGRKTDWGVVVRFAAPGVVTAFMGEALIGTGTVAAVMVDVARLLVYGASFYVVRADVVGGTAGLVAAATLSAFPGAFLGTRLIKKVTMRAVHLVVGVMLIVVGVGMASGLL